MSIATAITCEKEFRAQWFARFKALEPEVSAPELSAFLGISLSNAYKRKRGETGFTTYEMWRLAERYSIPLQPSPDADTIRVSFEADRVPASGFDPERYLARLERPIARFGGSLSDVSLTISTTDIPILWLFNEPTLALVKRYAFTYFAATRAPEAFDLATALNEQAAWAERARAIALAHASVASVEIWGHRPLATFLNQIERLAYLHAIRRRDVDAIFAALVRVAEQMFESAATARKAGGGAFALYVNDSHSTCPLILVSSGGQHVLHLTLDHPHVMSSADPEARAYYLDHVERIRRYADHVNGVGRSMNSRVLRTEMLERIEDKRVVVQELLRERAVAEVE